MSHDLSHNSPMNGTLSPLDIGHRQFPGRPGGYDRASVRAFLGQAADQLEALLHERQALRGRLTELERELEERRHAEDEIRRAVIAAERIGHDLRENSARQCELMLEQAQTRRDAVEREAGARATELETAHQGRMQELGALYQAQSQELERGHQARMQELEAAFRGRFGDLERDHHQLTLDRDRAHAERTVYLERAFNERHTELSSRLSAVRTEYTQFVSQYRALVQSFAELSARHLPPGDDLPLPASPLVAQTDRLTLEEPREEPQGGAPLREGVRPEEQAFA